MNRSNPQRTAFVAIMIVLGTCGTCGTCGQTSPLPDLSVAQKLLAPLSATDPVAREGLFTIDVDVTDTAGKSVSDLTASDFTLLDNGRPAEIRTFHGSLAVIELIFRIYFWILTVDRS
jgi:hypothetical protein